MATRLSSPESSCVTLSESTALMVSTSLVSRLIRSPWALVSKKRKRQRLQPGEEVRAQVAHRALGRAGHDVGLQPGQQRTQRIDDEHEPADARQQRQIARRHRIVDGHAQQVRAQHHQPGVHHHDQPP